MTDTQTEKPGNGKAVAVRAPLETGGKIMAIVPQNMEAAFRLANAIAAAGVAPKSYNNDANKIMVGIMHGLEAGLPPMAALQSIAVINGMPTIWGDGALALVRASGLLEAISETLEGTGDALRAVCTMRRRGEPDPIVRTFSVGDAKLAALWGKRGQNGQPTPWVTFPQRMLQMRARAWAMRDGFADVLKGLVPREEAQDMGTLVDHGEGVYSSPPPRPARDVEPAKAGHQDLDEQFRQTLREPPPSHDAETGEITPSTTEAAGASTNSAEPAEASVEGRPASNADAPAAEGDDLQFAYDDITAYLQGETDPEAIKRTWAADVNVPKMKTDRPELYAKALGQVNARIKELRK